MSWIRRPPPTASQHLQYRGGPLGALLYVVGAYITGAYWFTSSTSFANPAVTIARMFSDSFAGIAPASVPPFVLAQAVGGASGYALIGILYPDATLLSLAKDRHDQPDSRSLDPT